MSRIAFVRLDTNRQIVSTALEKKKGWIAEPQNGNKKYYAGCNNGERALDSYALLLGNISKSGKAPYRTYTPTLLRSGE